MRFTVRLAFLSLCLCALLLVSGCGAKEPARINLVMSAGNDVNPDAAGRPLSVVVRIYQLKDKGRLESADYNALARSDSILAEDIVERQERVMQPGTQQTLDMRANPMANYLAVVALFRDPPGDSWRKTIPIGGDSLSVSLSLREQSIDIVSTGK